MKSLLLTTSFLFLYSLLPAQTGINLLWQKELTNTAGPKTLELNAVQALDNGTVVAGYSSTQVGIIMYIARYQTNGTLAWDTTLATPNNSSFLHLALDNQGNIYAVGSEIIGGFNERQIHLIKFNANGQVQWHQTYRGPSNQYASPGRLRQVGNYLYLAGSEKSSQNYEVTWLAQYDLNGNLQWDQTFDPGSEAGFADFAVDNAGKVTAVGYADYGYSFLAVQYASNGTLNWQYPDTLTSDVEAYLVGVAADDNGNLYAVGTLETGPFSEQDIVTLKLNQDGEFLWQKQFNNGDANSGAEIRLGTNGTIYTFGNKEDNFDEFALIIAYDSSGAKLWEVDYEIDFYTTVVAAELAANGDIYLGVQDFDSLGFVRYSSTGALQTTKTYGANQAQYLTDISLSADHLYATGVEGEQATTTLFSLQSNTLAEEFLAQPRGEALSDAQPGTLITDGNHLWLSTFSDDGDTGRFAITKLDPGGQVLWERSKSYSAAIPSFSYLQHDGAGNVAGLFQNSKNVSAGYSGLLSYDANGTERFTVLLDSAVVYDAGGLALDNAGNSYITGINTGTKQMFISRYDATGTLQWTRFYQSPSSSFPYSKPYEMKYTAGGKLVIAAIHKGANNDNDLHIFQYTTDGTLEWHKDVANQSGNLTDFAGMEIATNGDISIFGSSGIGNYVAARFDSTGTLLWDEKGSTGSLGAPRRMAVDTQGRTYLCFSTNSHVYVRLLNTSGGLITDAQLSLPSTGSFYFPWRCAIVNDQLAILGEHLTPAGGVPFQMLLDNQLSLVYGYIDSLQRAKIQAMAVDPTGDLYGAYTTGDLSLSEGYRGALVRKYTIGTVGLEGDFLPGTQSMRIYPNPAREEIWVGLDVTQPGQYRFSLYDLQGRRVARLGESTLTPGLQEIRFSLPAQLNEGVYLLGVASEQGRTFRRLMVR
ncbi:MAG: PQQ-binding-like beta-propeller repeat protein [Bacteroidia bacterium]